MRLSAGIEGDRFEVLNYNSLKGKNKEMLEQAGIFPGTILEIQQRTKACCTIVNVDGGKKWHNLRRRIGSKIMVKKVE